MTATFSGEGATDVRLVQERPGGQPAGLIYDISLQLPAQIAGLDEKYPGGSIQFFSLGDLAKGEYVVVNPGAPTIADPHVLGATFAARYDLLWRSVGGSVTIAKGDSLSRARSGSFSVKFVSFKNIRDTIEIAGKFDIR